MKCIRILIKGKVQGVFYRASAKDVALVSDIKGWIKNKKDGDVEAFACGTEEALNEFVEWCKKGPAHAEVKEIEVSDFPEPEEPLDGFHVVKDDWR